MINFYDGPIIKNPPERSDGNFHDRTKWLVSQEKTWGQCKKTKKGAADMLRYDDERQVTSIEQGRTAVPIYSPEQRSDLMERAGDAYKVPGEKTRKAGGTKAAKNPKDPFARRKSESVDEYVARINILITEE